MVKWKKMNKKMAGLLLGVMMLFTASTTAFAYVDESAEASKVETTQTEQSTDKEEKKDDKKDEVASTSEVLPEDGTDKGTVFTTPGNGEVKDDITDDSTKEFLTVTTKNNNTFYIVIDRSATSQNVYMLSQIDENDLSEFLDKDSTATVVTPHIDNGICHLLQVRKFYPMSISWTLHCFHICLEIYNQTQVRSDVENGQWILA